MGAFHVGRRFVTASLRSGQALSGSVSQSAEQRDAEYEEMPDEAFTIIVFDDEGLQGITGVAHKRPEFSAAM